MIVFKKAIGLQQHLQKIAQKEKIGLVPTMGALHEGHLKLLATAQQACTVSICSIFVNPIQFNNPQDFQLYPVTIEKDIEKLEAAGCTILFLPDVAEMYPPAYKAKNYALGYLENILEGAYRPGHFQGVCQAVDRLLEIVNPDALFMGQKDYQQSMVIQKLLQLTHREHIKLSIVPTKREPSGLAMSSRNMRLNEKEKEAATALYKALTFSKAHAVERGISAMEKESMEFLKSSGFEVDYFEIRNAATLHPVTDAAKEKLVALVAASVGGVRLIDNMLLN